MRTLRRLTRSSLVVLAISVVSVHGLAPAEAGASALRVRFVLLCAKDRDCTDRQLGDLKQLAGQVRSWYQDELTTGETPRTFRMLETTKVETHDASWYGDSVLSARSKIRNAYRENPDGYGSSLYEPRVKTVAVFGFELPTPGQDKDHCGYGKGYLALFDPFDQNCSAWTNSGVAHELGHTWGLDHREDETLMNEPKACNGRTLDQCDLNRSQKKQLLRDRSAWFVTS